MLGNGFSLEKILNDTDLLLICAIAYAIWKETSDMKLIIALAYVFLF